MMPSSRETKYQQVARLIEERYICPADENMPLPTERQLQDIFSVSRDTVRRALRELADAGLIYHVQGSGTYVAPRKHPMRAPSLRSFTDDMAARGHRPHSLTLTCHLIEAPLAVQRDLNLDAGAKVIQIQRLRQADGSPIALETAHFLPQAFSHVEPELSASLDAQMRASGFQVETATVRVVATNLTQAEAAQLGVPLGAAALRVEKVGYTVRGLPVESTQTLYRGDRYDFELEVKR
ncbi:GntR family transcriptional regulator [Rothia nasimurium]|uniref:GntR family transcriptional regulator n=1 Tax=Rothia nasimurium TaxID=85336 RepID=UPI001F471CD9|nr:GntR family transcriptional regulator [Rothia nasimurium]